MPPSRSKSIPDRIALLITCTKCGSSDIRTGTWGYHCTKCGSFDLDFDMKDADATELPTKGTMKDIF